MTNITLRNLKQGVVWGKDQIPDWILSDPGLQLYFQRPRLNCLVVIPKAISAAVVPMLSLIKEMSNSIVSVESETCHLWFWYDVVPQMEIQLEQYIQRCTATWGVPDEVYVVMEGRELVSWTRDAASAMFYFDAREGRTEESLAVWRRLASGWDKIREKE